MAKSVEKGVSPVGAQHVSRGSLRRYAGVWSLWALGISGVIPGEYSGWSYGLITGGFGGMLVATLVVIVMYLGLCFSLSEMSSAMPFSGGAYAYGRAAMGVWGGYLAGIAQNIEYVLTAAAVVVSVGDSADTVVYRLTGTHVPDVLTWAIAYAIFTAINVYGIKLTCRIALLLSVLALAVLAYFAISALPYFDIALALDVPIAAHGSSWLPNGMLGIAWSMPFAIWFLVVIELLTLTGEETNNPETTLPKGILYGIATLIVAALLVLFLNSAVPPGAKEVGNASQPLLLGFEGILGSRSNPVLLALFALSAYVAGFHATIYAYGRSIFSLARAGYIPSWLSMTHATRNTPHHALIAGSLVGLVVAVVIKVVFPDLHVDAVLLHIAVLAAIVSYVFQMLSFLMLRRDLPHMKRPYVSALGATGAMTALVIALAVGVLMFLDPSYRAGLTAGVVIYGISILVFVFRGRRNIVTAPEEAFAIEHARR